MDEPAWIKEKAELDALDDGNGPDLYWAFASPEEATQIRARWDQFLKLAGQYLGQGYSLACYDGTILDVVTSNAFEWYVIGTKTKEYHE